MDSARAHHIAADLGDPNSLDRFVVEPNDWLDGRPLHALVNNAGWSPKTPYKERLGCLNGDLAAWRQVFELNFFAPLTLARGFDVAQHRDRGAIVTLLTAAGTPTHPSAA